MAGLFDPSMFDPNAFGSPQAGMLARLAGMAGYRPTPQSILPGQPGTDAMASGLVPPQPPQAPQGGQPMSPPFQGGSQGGGFLSGLGDFLRDNRAGLAGITQFIGGGGLHPQLLNQGMNQDYQRNMQQGSLASTYQALIQSGIPAAQAQAMTLNPELLKTLAPQHFAKPVWGDIGTDPMTGLPQKGWIDSNTRQVTDAAGNPIGGAGAAQSGSIPNDLQGEDLYSAIAAHPQLGPSKANQVRGIVEGRIPLPSGTALRVPANQWLANMALQAEPGATAQDFHQRQVTQNDLGKSGNSNLGGIILNGNSAFEHLGTYTDALANLKNKSNAVLPDWEASIENRLKNQTFGNSEAANKISSANGAALKYGQESTKFYSGTGGGEGERMAALNGNDPVTSSGQKLAGFAQTERDLMVGRMKEAEAKIRTNMGDAYLEKHPIFTPDLKQKIARVDANIAKLQGKAPATTDATQATSALPAGWTVQVK